MTLSLQKDASEASDDYVVVGSDSINLARIVADLANRLKRMESTVAGEVSRSDQQESKLRDIGALVKDATAPYYTKQRSSATHFLDLVRRTSPKQHLSSFEDLPGELQDIRDAISASRHILTLSGDDLEEGAPPYTESTWKRAVDFLAKNAWWAFVNLGRRIDAPQVLPGPHGSIDLHWDVPAYELLINIPEAADTPAGFYGDDRGKVSIEGTVEQDSVNNGLLFFLTRT